MKSFLLLGTLLAGAGAFADTSPRDLKALQQEIQRMESSIQGARQTEASLNSELQKLERLLKLQGLEIQLSALELEKLEEKVQEMLIRRSSLEESIQGRKKRVRDLLSVLPSLEYKTPIARLTEDNRMFVVMFRESVAKLLAYEKSEMAALRKYLVESEELNARLQEERDRLAARTDDLREKQTILGLNKDLKKDLLKRTRGEQVQRLQAYQAAKAAESELEAMLSRLNAAPAAQDVVSAPAAAPVRPAPGGGFAQRKGKLIKPVSGPVVGNFGKKYDPATSLYTFHKGVDLESPAGSPVSAVHPGKVVFSGTLGGYGQLLIIDHGDQYFTLCGQLGETLKKIGETVAEGETIARSSASGAPVYFEIRQRHIAVNPAPWFN